MKRNGYIDVIKFLFAIVIAEFHLGTGLFMNGRIAVDGFFMISGYLMMRSAEKNPYVVGELGSSSIRFLFRKYISLFTVLFPAVILSSIVNAISRSMTVWDYFKNMPLLLFEIIPLNTAGFRGWYVVGISWYLSSMFIALALLYPICQRFKSSGVLIFCLLTTVLGYGLLSGLYGNIAVGSAFIDGSILHTGVIRGLAGCSLGCIIFEIHKKVEKMNFTRFARTVFTVFEVFLFLLVICAMHGYISGKFDFVSVFIMFIMLLLGICGLSFTGSTLNQKWTKHLGTMSTLIVLTHYCWIPLFKVVLPNNVAITNKVILYVAAILSSCLLVHLLSGLLNKLIAYCSNKHLWLKEEKQNQDNVIL